MNLQTKKVKISHHTLSTIKALSTSYNNSVSKSNQSNWLQNNNTKLSSNIKSKYL